MASEHYLYITTLSPNLQQLLARPRVRRGRAVGLARARRTLRLQLP